MGLKCNFEINGWMLKWIFDWSCHFYYFRVNFIIMRQNSWSLFTRDLTYSYYLGKMLYSFGFSALGKSLLDIVFKSNLIAGPLASM